MLRREEFVTEFSRHGYTKKDARVIIDDMFDTIKDILVRGDSVNIPGFGRFEVKRRKGRRCVNPQTLEPNYIEEHNGVQFTTSPVLRQAVNNSTVI